MIEKTLLIEPYDPVIFRDGRPFTDGLPATTLPFPLPASTAGAIRSRSGEGLDFDDNNVIDKLLAIRQVGPFAAAWNPRSTKWELVFRAPSDAVAYGDSKFVEYARLRPGGTELPGGCDLPDGGLRPLFVPRQTKINEAAPAFWHASFLLDWLGNGVRADKVHDPSQIGFNRLPTQRRAHVAIDPDTLLARDGMLFTTDGLEFYWPASEEKRMNEGRLTGTRGAIVSRVVAENPVAWPRVAPLGGERRLALWRELSSAEIDWPAPVRPTKDLIRLVLVTPGIFAEGWKPGWLRTGKLPGTKDLELELVAASVPRFQPVSGWDLRKGQRGPKETRFLAPAGSVYFCRFKGDPAQLWMQSICDGEQDRLDGYGIVLTGDC